MISETFTPPGALSTPVLFLVFNRPDTTKQVFEEIKKAKPPRLYIAADGHRKQKPGEAEKVNEVRTYLLENIDWECEVKTLFREENLGCKYAVSGAITWFFENEEQGIILEDDCLPSQSFFWFCEELLKKYKDNLAVGHIGGNNFQKGIRRGDADYYFSNYGHIWGWATWRDRWLKYDVELEDFIDNSFIIEIFKNRKAQEYWSKVFERMKNKLVDTWDFQWTFTLWKFKFISIVPQKNMVTNIGFGSDATHTNTYNPHSNLKRFEIFNLQHPSSLKINMEADLYISKSVFYPSKFMKLVRMIKGLTK